MLQLTHVTAFSSLTYETHICYAMYQFFAIDLVQIKHTCSSARMSFEVLVVWAVELLRYGQY